jgi:CBS-domain-containing membrane protein
LVQLCFSDLEASTSGVVGVAPTDTVERAGTLMALRDFSQLPALSGPRALNGVICWKSLGEARLRGHPTEVRECMSAPNVVALASAVLPALSVVSAHDFVLVQDRDATVSGIVTAADMTLGFGWLAKPFLLLLGEVERRLRGLLSRGGRPEDLLADIVPASDSPP